MFKHSTLVTLLGISIALGLVGCDKRRSAPKSTPTQPPATEAPAQQKTIPNCDIRKDHFKKDMSYLQAEAQTVTIERHYQRVVRKDCTGTITSDKVETVKSPTYDLDLKALGKRKFKAVYVFNENSCAHKLSAMPVANPIIVGHLYNVTGDGKTGIKIKGDLAKALLTFKLEQNENQIFVEYFYDCSPKSAPGNTNAIIGDATCEASADSTRVVYPIQVNYTEKNLDGTKEEIPSVESCQDQK